MLRSIISRKSTVFRHASNLNHGVQKLGLGVQNIRFSSSNVVVSFKKVSFGYDENKLLLENVDFNIREGAKVTIMGQNGAGKSSIIKLLNGQLVPSLGGELIDNDEAVMMMMMMMMMITITIMVSLLFSLLK
jgi:ABC-type bacteriocin/lantibiotic exporter with double-glycine peptidase domain